MQIPPEEIVPVLLAALQDRVPVKAQRAAVGAIRDFGPVGKALVPSLVPMLKLRYISLEAWQALAVLDPENPALSESAATFVRRDRANVSAMAAAGKAAVRPFVKALETQDIRDRLWIIEGLGRIGPNATEAVPALERFLDDDEEALRLQAADALRRIRGS